LLVAPKLSEVDKFFVEGKEYVGYTSIDEAVEKIKFYMEHEPARKKIAKAGREKVEALVRARIFWLAIDLALGDVALK